MMGIPVMESRTIALPVDVWRYIDKRKGQTADRVIHDALKTAMQKWSHSLKVIPSKGKGTDRTSVVNNM
jgi:hypothetical protein